MYLCTAVKVSVTFAWINYNSCTEGLKMTSKTVMNIPNHKLSSSSLITVYVWYRSKVPHYSVGLFPEQEASLLSQPHTSESLPLLPHSALLSTDWGFVSKWNFQTFYLDCPQSDSSNRSYPIQ